MSECQFDHVVVIGYGVVTGEVLKTVYSLASKYGYTYEYIEHEELAAKPPSCVENFP